VITQMTSNRAGAYPKYRGVGAESSKTLNCGKPNKTIKIDNENQKF